MRTVFSAMLVVIACFCALNLNAQQLTYAAPINITARTPVFDGSPFSLEPQETFPTGIALNPDGTKMFIVSSSNGQVTQYSLNTPFDITSGVSFDGNPFSISSQETSPRDIAFSADGLKMFIVGNNSGAEVNQYSLTTPFDITSGVSFDASPFFIGEETRFPGGFAFSPDGMKMFIVGSFRDDVNQYSLTTPFDITSGVSFDGNPFITTREESAPEGIAFSPDGMKMFIVGVSGLEVNQYSLTTPFDITSGVSLDGTPFNTTAQESSPTGIAFSPNGVKMFIVGASQEVNQYSLSDNSVFLESVQNNGSVEGGLELILEGDIFTNIGSTLTSPAHFTIDNLPTGLIPTITVGPSGRTALLTLSGMASTNTNAEDVESLQFTFADGAFVASTAADVTNAIAASSGFGIDFDLPIQLITPNILTIPENNTFITDIVAFDGQGGGEDENLTYSITGGPDRDAFTVDEVTGILTVNFRPDFESPRDSDGDNEYEVEISINKNGNVTPLMFLVQVIDREESITYAAPIDITVQTPVFDGNPFSVRSQDRFINGITFSSDGMKMYIVSGADDEINQYSLTVPFDISSGVTFDGSPLSVKSQEEFSEGITFSPNGMKMYIVGGFDGEAEINQYSLATPFDVTSGVSFDGNPFSISSEETNPQGITFSPDGMKMFIVGNSNDQVYQYSLTQPFDVTDQIRFDGNSFSVKTQEESPSDLAFSPDGMKMYIIGSFDEEVNQYSLTTPFDITSGVSVDGSPFSVGSQESTPRGLAFSPDGRKMIIVGWSNEVNQYTLSDGQIFQESVRNDGSVSGGLNLVLDGDQFINAGSTLTSPTHFSIDNLPEGLTPIISVGQFGRTASLTLIGVANANGDMDDVTSLQFAFTDAAFVASIVEDVTNGITDSTGFGIDFYDGPLFTSVNAINFTENSTDIVIDINANDGLESVNDTGITYSLTGNIDDDLFFIDINTGELSFITAPDFENPLDSGSNNMYDVLVIATDTASGNQTEQQIIITVTDVDDQAPTITSPSSINIEENISGSIYTATADESVSFALGTTKDENLFTLALGKISFKEAPDFENPLDSDENNTYLVDLIATDNFGNKSEMEVIITITDLDDTPLNVEIERKRFILSPNPVTNYFTIDVSKLKNRAIEKIVVMSIHGIKVKTFTFKPDKSYDLHNIQEGLYFIYLLVNDQLVSTTKFLKKE